MVILDGGNAVRVINISAGTVVLDGLTIQNGTGLNGGGIYNNGTLTVQNTAVISNTATGSFVNDEGFGAGVFTTNGSTLTVINSTISGNNATEDAGGIGVAAGGSATINISNSAIVNNHEQSGLGGGGLSLVNSVTKNVKNSIIANNTSGSSSTLSNSLSALTSQGYNISDDDPFSGGALASDFINTDPRISSLADNGGPNKTHALQFDSPAIDTGEPTGCQNNFGANVTTDQRGQSRDDLRCDIGAFELKLTDSIVVAKSIASGDTVSFGPTLVEISRSGGNDPGIVTITKRENAPGGGTPEPGEMPIHWNITPSGSNSGLNLTLKLCYTNSELAAGNNIAEGSLVLFRNTGGPS